MKPTNFRELADSYIESPQFQSLSISTQEQWMSLMESLVKKGNYLQLQYESNRHHTMDMGDEWNKRIQGESNWKKTMLKKQLSKVYKFGIKHHGLSPDSNPADYMPNFRHEKKESNPFTKEEIFKVRDYRRIKNSVAFSKQELRISYLIEFLFETGMRPNEAINLRMCDVIVEGKNEDGTRDELIQIIGAKWHEAGKVSRYVPVTPNVRKILDKVAEMREPKDGLSEDWLFTSMTGRKIKAQNLHKNFTSIMKKVGIKGKTLYDLRRGCATEIIHNPEYGVTVAQKVLGHKDIRTTMIYEQLSKKKAARLFKGHSE